MKLKGGFETRDPRLDRVPQWDARNERFPVAARLRRVGLRPRAWRLTARLDQGREGACVGFGWAHELQAMPSYHRMSNEQAIAIYRRAQQLDEWPGEQYSGTSVLAGAKAVVELGHLAEYRWALGSGEEMADDVLATLAELGPVVIGVDWHAGMEDTDPAGFVEPTGAVLGGHCVALRGLGRAGGEWYALGRNSWGEGWGVRGDFKLRRGDLAALFDAGGEACVPLVRR